MIQSGEPHRPSARRSLTAPATFRMLYVDPPTLLAAAAEVAARPSEVPYVPALATSDPVLVAAVLQLHASAAAPTSQLELDERLLAVLSRLYTAHTHAPANGSGGGRTDACSCGCATI